MIDEYQRKLDQAISIAQALGSKLEDSLIGDHKPTEKEVKAVYEGITAQRELQMNALFEDDTDSLERLACEGAVTRILSKPNHKVLEWRIETEARVCASALMEAKRKDQPGKDQRGPVYEGVYGRPTKFIKAVTPEDIEFGWMFARPNMEKADKEGRASW